MIAYSLLSVVPEVFEDVPVCLEVQIAGPVDSGKARRCEGYQGFCFNPSDDAPEARRGVCVCVCVCVCVWNFSREVKLVPALPWQYSGNIRIYSVELLLHLVFRMSICLFFLCLLEKFYPYCSTFLAGGQSSLMLLCPTKLCIKEGSQG